MALLVRISLGLKAPEMDGIRILRQHLFLCIKNFFTVFRDVFLQAKDKKTLVGKFETSTNSNVTNQRSKVST